MRLKSTSILGIHKISFGNLWEVSGGFRLRLQRARATWCSLAQKFGESANILFRSWSNVLSLNLIVGHPHVLVRCLRPNCLPVCVTVAGASNCHKWNVSSTTHWGTDQPIYLLLAVIFWLRTNCRRKCTLINFLSRVTRRRTMADNINIANHRMLRDSEWDFITACCNESFCCANNQPGFSPTLCVGGPVTIQFTGMRISWLKNKNSQRILTNTQPSATCSTSLPAQHLRPSGLFSCQYHSLEFSPGFHPGPDHQCRLFQTFAQNVPVRSILVHSAR